MKNYKGDYKSAIARAKRILLAAGFVWSKTTGRYPNSKTSNGVCVVRIGHGLRLVFVFPIIQVPGETRAATTRATEALRAGGLPFDDRGWLE